MDIDKWKMASHQKTAEYYLICYSCLRKAASFSLTFYILSSVYGFMEGVFSVFDGSISFFFFKCFIYTFIY